MDLARKETRTDDAARKFGVAGRNVLVAIIDRGLELKNNDFRNPDGTTRVEGVLDLTDPTGASAPGNPYGAGTLYTKQQIEAHVSGGTQIPFRDAVGHGTTTTGIAAGNGRNSRNWKYRGEAPKARILVVKIVAGAAAHDNEPAEATAQYSLNGGQIPIDYVLDRAQALGLPVVMLPNVGSVGFSMDGTSNLAKKIDASVGPGKPGKVFVTGASDDGGRPNHAMSTLAVGETVTLQIDKKTANGNRFELWYPEAYRYDVTIQTPEGTFGPYVSPATNNASSSQNGAGFSYLQSGSSVVFAGPTNRRQIRIDFTGAPGAYSVSIRATASGPTPFHAWINTVNGDAEFKNFVVPGYTVWDAASAFNNITPNDYVLREKWPNLQGVVESIREDHVGDLWEGSGIGPLVDGRLGIDISAPGNTVMASFASNSAWGTNQRIQDGNGFYTPQNAVSAAAPQVTGIIALILEINPTLDANQVRQILRDTARRDAFTGPDPNPRWGYGKIDALAAIQKASEMPGAKQYFSVDKNEVIVDFPTGSATPADTTITVTPGNGAGAFSTSSSAAWLSATPASGTAPGQVVLKVNPGGLTNGDYSGEITISHANGQGVPQTIMVHLHVRAPGPLITEVLDGGAIGPGFANGGWVAIKGYGLSNTTRIWTGADFVGDKLPTVLDGVRVNIFGKPAYVYYVSPTQVNVLAPDNELTNTRFGMTLFNNGVASNQFIANVLERNPEFLKFDTRHIVATHADNSLLGPPDLYGGAVTLTPGKPGETIVMWGTGCGPTNPPILADRIVTVAGTVTAPTTVTIGGKNAAVAFSGQVGSGLCQVNATIPDVPDGDQEVVVTIGNFVSADGAFIRVKR
jgi:uncharacterized protein (TIGR03437 family)